MPNISITEIIPVVKYVAAVAIFIAIVCTPAYLARQTKKDGTPMGYIRLASWLFGWTGIGWLWALFQASRQ